MNNMPYSFLTNHHFYNFDEILGHLDIRPGHCVLDLGCGHNGYWTFPLAQLVGKTGEVHAIDIFQDALKNIKQKSAELKLSQINAILADLEKLNKASLPKADAALLINTLYQVKNQAKLLSAIRSLLKPQAKLLIIDWRKNINPYGPPQDLRIADEQMQKLIKKSKFDLAQDLHLADDHFAKVLVKV